MGTNRYVQQVCPDELENDEAKKFIFDTVQLTN